jgi:predicted metal-binding protein
MLDENVKAALAELGVSRYGEVQVSEVVFDEAFRASCESNQCGKFGTNWSCPPGVGEPAALIAQARRFQSGLVIQTVWPLEDMFDFDGMMAGGDKHNALFRSVVARVAPLLSSGEKLTLSAGACTVCETCTYPDGQPCRLPQKALASLESYGIDVARLIASSGLSYNNGPNTVSYVGLILFGSSAAKSA